MRGSSGVAESLLQVMSRGTVHICAGKLLHSSRALPAVSSFLLHLILIRTTSRV